MVQILYDQCQVMIMMSRKYDENWLKTEGGVVAIRFYNLQWAVALAKKGPMMTQIKHNLSHVVTPPS